MGFPSGKLSVLKRFHSIVDGKKVSKDVTLHIAQRERNFLLIIHQQKDEEKLQQHVVRLCDDFPCHFRDSLDPDDDSPIELALEYVRGYDLCTVLQEFTIPPPESDCKQLFQQLLYTVARLKKIGICHRDVKPENLILAHKRNKLVLVDFGLAVSSSDSAEVRKRPKGTMRYIAPEVWLQTTQGSLDDLFCADLFSVGLTLFSMLTQCLMYEEHEHIIYLFQNKVEFDSFVKNRLALFKDEISLGAQDLLSKMLRWDPRERLSYLEIRAHPWLQT